MNRRIHKYGFIIGGACEERLRRRHERAEGAKMAWNDIKNRTDHVTFNKGWYQINQNGKYKHFDYYGGGEKEIGYLRMIQITFPNLIASGRRFRLSNMITWIEGLASADFIMGGKTPLAGLSKDDPIKMGLVPPKMQDDVIYEKLHGVPRGILRLRAE